MCLLAQVRFASGDFMKISYGYYRVIILFGKESSTYQMKKKILVNCLNLFF